MDKVNQADYKTSTMRRAKLSRFEVGEILAAALLLVWRLAAASPSSYWKDWMLIAALFWIVGVFRSQSENWSVVTVAVMSYLLGIYILGQLPHALTVMGMRM